MLYKQVSQTEAIILDQTYVQKRKNSRPKNMVQRSSCILLRNFTKKEDLLVLKMDAEQLPHEIYAIVGSKKLQQKQKQRTRMSEELYIRIY